MPTVDVTWGGQTPKILQADGQLQDLEGTGPPSGPETTRPSASFVCSFNTYLLTTYPGPGT